MNGQDRSDLLGDLRESTNRAVQRLTESLDRVAQDRSAGRASSKQLEDAVRRQQAILERVMESAAFIGEVVEVRGDEKDPTSDILVSCYGRIIAVKPLPGVNLFPGNVVKLAPNSSQIIDVIGFPRSGSVCFVRRIVNENVSEVDFNGTTRIVMNGMFSDKIKANDRVVLDSSGSVIVSWLGKLARENFKVKPEATWDDIVGLEDAKRGLMEAIELPFREDRQFKHYNRKPFKGAFIFGPPGCGKTMLGEAAANALAELHGNEAMESGYFYVKGPEFLDMYVGNTEKGIRAVADEADAHFKTHGFPAIVFLDEAEALLSRRGSGKSADMEKTVVPTFLGVMNKSTAIFILATNRPDVMDPAVIRNGRISRHFYVTRPSRENSLLILEKNIAKYPIHPVGTTAGDLARRAAEEFYSENYHLIDEEIPLKNGSKIYFTMREIVNGAMLADGIVNRAAVIAERRDRQADQLTGITAEDLISATKENFEEQKRLDHRDEMKDFFRSLKDQFEPTALLQGSATK